MRRFLPALAAGFLIAGLSGCNQPSAEGTAAPVASQPPAGAPGSTMPDTAPAADVTPASAQGGKSGKGGPAVVEHGDKELTALEGKLAKKPKDAKLKSEVAAANYRVGHKMMLDPALGPRVKYRGALKLFARALELDPNHGQAAKEKKMIEDIYRSMGRPVPE